MAPQQQLHTVAAVPSLPLSELDTRYAERVNRPTAAVPQKVRTNLGTHFYSGYTWELRQDKTIINYIKSRGCISANFYESTSNWKK